MKLIYSGLEMCKASELSSEITHRPALGTIRLIARKMLYVRCVDLLHFLTII